MVEVRMDVLVVGAGPAGLTAARVISSKGFSVTVLEKERHLGAKPCGEAVSKKTVEDAEIEDPREFIAQELNSAHVYAPNGEMITIGGSAGEGYIVNKPLFLQCMAEEAADSGAQIKMGRRVKGLEREGGFLRAEANGGVWRAPLILGADGFSSTVSRSLLREEAGSRELISCIQYVMVNCNLRYPHTAEFFLGRQVAPLGYAWVFPRGGGKANVGIGVRGTSAKPYLDKFLRDHSETFSKAQAVGVEGAPVTISGLLERVVGDGVMLAGEAAGQVIPLTGGGIHSSIIGGRMAGETAVKALTKDQFSRRSLLTYVEEYNREWGQRIGASLRALRALEALKDDDLNKLAGLLEPQDILDLANGSNISRVARKFLRHPLFSLKLAKTLLKD